MYVIRTYIFGVIHTPTQVENSVSYLLQEDSGQRQHRVQ